MPHPLEKFDGNRRYVFTALKGSEPQKLFLRIVTSATEIQNCLPSVNLFCGIRTDALKDLETELQFHKKTLVEKPKAPSAEENAARAARARSNAPKQFGKENNFTYFIIENESGNPVLALALTINDPMITRNLELENKNNFFFIGTIIDQSLRGQGLAKQCFNEIFAAICENIDEYSGDKTQDLEIIAPVGAALTLNQQGKPEEHLIHSSMYIDMLRQICGDEVSLQPRIRIGWDDDYEKVRGPRIKCQDLTPEIIDREMVRVREESQMLKSQGQSDVGVGAFIIGTISPEKLHNFPRLKDEVSQAGISKKVIAIDPTVSQSWVRAMPQTPAVAVSASGHTSLQSAQAATRQ